MSDLNDFMNFFSMERMPFTNNIGTEFLFQNSMQDDIKHKLRLTVESNSFALLTGQPGTGKSTALRSFTSTLSPEQYCVFYVSISNASPRWLYSVPLESLGIKAHLYVNDARKQFHEELKTQINTYKRKVVMIIDEAHLLTQSYRKYAILEEIRFLLNGDPYDSGSLLSLILTGQTEICQTLQDDRCKAITQRIVYICQTRPLLEEQVGPYIAAHLRWAKVTDRIFTPEAVKTIARLSEGYPRLINKLCIHALNYAGLNSEKTVNEHHVELAAKNEVIDVILKNVS
jgi:type II secretory pathway predicted ATPase ExeA